MADSTLTRFICLFFLYLSQLRNHVSLSWLKLQQQSQITLKFSRRTTAAYQKVDFDKGSASYLDINAEYWWSTAGYALSILLEKAGYSSHAQYRLLDSIWTITPSLGPRLAPRILPRWRSFMTDNHIPIELSWDWRTEGQPPKIRFSIEPVGFHAGTPLDPHNRYAASQLRDTIARFLPKTDVEWMDHFQTRLNGDETKAISDTVEGHKSTEFYAFDLNEDGSIMAKAYFFPGFKAAATKQSNFDVICDTISTAPDSTAEKLEALNSFREYVYDTACPRLEMDMLAIDLVRPAESRFKIYFRIRDTSFDSIKNTMTLGGRVRSPHIDLALRDLRQLYYALVSPGARVLDDSTQPQAKDHRTAGILYNVEFKYGSKSPKVKVYLPVRHFARSEEAIISTLEAHFKHRKCSSSSRTDMSNYREALRTIL
ncbi:hypothetical protein diail_9418 [Diaporthe ilicicola]|nr:hypothetical protein diail_9418 [Diaporthe ilicicola]